MKKTEGYTVEDLGQATHDHNKCIAWYSPYVFGYRLFIYYGCMGHCIQFSHEISDKLERIVKTIKLPYKKGTL